MRLVHMALIWLSLDDQTIVEARTMTGTIPLTSSKMVWQPCEAAIVFPDPRGLFHMANLTKLP
jgi:hypothetical protein